MCLFAQARGGANATETAGMSAYRYWFNTDTLRYELPLPPPTGSGSEWQLEVQPLGEPGSLNVLHWQVKDTAGRYSVAHSSFYFQGKARPHTMAGYTYWFNQDLAGRVDVPLNETATLDQTITLDVSAFSVGMNALHMAYYDAHGFMSPTISRYFFRVEDGIIEGAAMKLCQYWFDANPADKTDVDLLQGQDGLFLTEIRTDSLVPGLHRLHLRFADENQRWSPTTSAYFLKRDYSDGQSLGVKAYEYWWQGDTVVHTVNLDVPVNPSEWVIQLDMKPMQEGTHVLHFRSCDTKGLWSVTTTHELERVPIPLFSADRTTLCDKGVIRFHNDMDSARFDFHWDYGDGSTQVAFEPAHAFRAPGTYVVMLTALDRLGMADTTATLTINVYRSYLFEQDTIIQPGEGFQWHGQWLDASGLYIDKLTTSTGCDSTFTLNLSVADSLLSKPRSIQLNPSGVSENKPAGSLVGYLSAEDDDENDVHVFTLYGGDAHGHNRYFYLAGNALYTDTVFNYEQDSMYVVLVEVRDSKGYTLTQFVEVRVWDMPERPSALVLSSNSLPEEALVGTEIGLLSTVDEDLGDSFVYRLVAGEGDVDNDLFTLDGNRLLTATNLDYERQNRYFIRVEAEDAHGLRFSRSFTILVTDVPEGDVPAFTNIRLSDWQVPENLTPPVFIGVLTAEGASSADANFAFAVGDGDFDNDDFFLSNDSLYANVAFDFERRSIFFTRIQAADNKGNTWSKLMVVLAEDVNESPYALFMSRQVVEEQLPVRSFVGSFTALDPDLGDVHSFRLVDGEGAVDNADFMIASDSLLTAKVLTINDGATRLIRVEALDLAGAGYVTTLQVTINPSTGLVSIEEAGFKAFVDGTALTVNLPVDALKPSSSIVLYNMLGQPVLRSKVTSTLSSWSLPHLSRGIYYLLLMEDDHPVHRTPVKF